MYQLSIVNESDVKYSEQIAAEFKLTKEKKPTIAFIGDSGVGKTSIIKAALTSVGDVKELSTTQPTLIEGININCLDLAGREKYDTTTKDQGEAYYQRVHQAIIQYKIEYFVVVVAADDERWKDCDSYYCQIILKLSKIVRKPFLYLINKIDKTNDMSLLNDRIWFIKNQFKETHLSSVYQTNLNPLFKGVFLVASAPRVMLKNICPYDQNGETLSDLDDLGDPHPTLDISDLKQLSQFDILKSQLIVCKKCKKYYMVDGFERTPDYKEHIVPLLKSFSDDTSKRKYPEPLNLSIGQSELSPFDVILETAEVQFVNNFLKEKFTKLEDRVKNARKLIDRIIKGVSKVDVSQVDGNLCMEIAQLFHFPRTAEDHKNIELTRWDVRVNWVDQIMSIFGDKDLEIILFAWGIFYVLKYSTIEYILMNESTSINQKVTECNTVLANYLGNNGGITFVQQKISKILNHSNSTEIYNHFLGSLEAWKRWWPEGVSKYSTIPF